MRLKDRKEVIRDMFKHYVKKDDNVILANKFFIINSIINYVYTTQDEKERMKLLLFYGDLITRYLKNEIDLHWEDGRVLVDEVEA
jgi:hypothetical protein